MNAHKKPFISVIIPAYNVENYIRSCLYSVIVQKIKNIEIIVINDDSTDNSLDIINEFACKDKRIKVINNTKNVGLSATRNIGLKIAQGRYIHFLDGDDYVAPYAYQELYEYALLNNLDILIFSHYRVNNKTTKVYNINYRLRAYKKKILSSVHDKQLLLKSKIGVTVWNKLYKRDFLISNNFFFKEGVVFEDILFYWQTILSAKYISILNIPFYYYVQRENSIMSSEATRNLDIIKILLESYKYLHDNNYLTHYADLYTDKLIKTYIDFYKHIKKSLKKLFFSNMQTSLKEMSLINYIKNMQLQRKLTIMQETSYTMFKILVKFKIIR